jgi:hypothetical protein
MSMHGCMHEMNEKKEALTVMPTVRVCFICFN